MNDKDKIITDCEDITSLPEDYIEGIKKLSDVLRETLYLRCIMFNFRIRNHRSLAAISVLMCVSYPLKITPICLHLVFCFALLSVNTFKGITYRLPVKFALMGVNVAIVTVGWINLYGYHRLREGQKHVFKEEMEKTVQLINHLKQ